MSSSRQSSPTASRSLRDLLDISHWTRSLSGEQLARVRADTVERFVPAGSYACRKGEAVEHWVGVAEGLLKLSTDSPEGKELAVAGRRQRPRESEEGFPLREELIVQINTVLKKKKLKKAVKNLYFTEFLIQ